MSVFSTNQNRQFYLAKRYADGSTVPAVGSVTSQAGDLGVKVKDGELFFPYQGANTPMRSDRISLKGLEYAKAFKAFDMAAPLKKVEVVLSSAVNSGNVINGEDYILRINLRQFYGMSDEDQYFKEGVVHGVTGMSASDFYKAMVDSLNKSFSREVGATSTSNPYLDIAVDNASTATKIIITEKIQPWTLGTQAQERVYFDVVPTTVFSGGNDVIWGTVTDATPAKYVEDTDSSSPTYQQMIPNSAIVIGTNAIGNGTQIADLEYFCMGERGDQYRMIGWPNNIPTKYLVDPTQQFDVLELHFAFTDTGVNSYKSEKDITIAVPEGASGHEYDVINAIIGAINSAASLSIATLS